MGGELQYPVFLIFPRDALLLQTKSNTGLGELELLLREAEADPASPGRRHGLDKGGSVMDFHGVGVRLTEKCRVVMAWYTGEGQVLGDQGED